MAAKYGKMEVASLLLQKGAAPDAAGKVRCLKRRRVSEYKFKKQKKMTCLRRAGRFSKEMIDSKSVV